MLFNSPAFFLFMGVVFLVYWFAPPRFRWVVLLLGSYYYYITWRPFPALWLAGVTLVAYAVGLGMERFRRRRALLLGVGLVVDLGLLFLLKYFNFVAGQLVLLMKDLGLATSSVASPHFPWALSAGLSFFTFSVVTYLVDVYNGKMPAEHHLGRLAVYVAYFPKIFAGPIERASTFLPQLLKTVRVDPEQMEVGFRLILWGLFKKVVIADRLATLVNPAYGHPSLSTPLGLLFATYFYAFEIYCDFSGYSDIAIGASKLIGINLMENFRRAYLARSTPEFWGRNRWHISLGTWFRDYMYIPMGGSRVALPRFYFNLMAVFIVSGFWHAGLVGGVGWSFMVWGALNGTYQVVSVAASPLWAWLVRKLPRLRNHAVVQALQILLTFHLITFAWIFFRASSISEAVFIVKRIWTGVRSLPMLIRYYTFTPTFWLSVGLIAFLMAVEVADEWGGLWEKVHLRPVAIRWSVYYGIIFALVILGEWGLHAFIYMQF